MNATQKKRVRSLRNAIEGIRDKLQEFVDAEQAKLDKMPWSMQDNLRYMSLENTVDGLRTAVNNLDDTITSLDSFL